MLVCSFLPCFPSRIYSILLFLLYTPFLFPGMNLETLTHISLVYTASNHHQEYFSIAVPSESNKFMSKQMEQSRKHTAIFLGHTTLSIGWSVFHVRSIVFLKTTLCLCISIPNLEKVMATHSSTLAWKIPWAEEPGRLQSMGSPRVGHDWSDLAATAAAFPIHKWTTHSQRGLRMHNDHVIIDLLAPPFNWLAHCLYQKSSIFLTF